MAKEKIKRRGMLFAKLAKLAFFAFIIYVLVNIISVQVSLSDKREELAALNERKAELELENEEYERLLNMENDREYMEQIAVEKLDYAYPTEIRFYDTSRN